MATNLANHKVHFEYGERTITIRQNKEKFQKQQPSTTCVISTLEGNEISRATVYLHHKDVNCKIEGREFAFRAAVHSIPDRNLRASLRKDYVTKMKTKKGVPLLLKVV